MKKLVVILALGTALISCRSMIDGTAGAVTSVDRNEGPFKSLQLEDNIDVFVTQDTAFTIRVQAGENLINYIETSVVGDKLVIYEAPNNVVNTKPIKVFLTMDSVHNISMEGSGNLDMNNMLSDHLNFVATGSGDINLEVEAQHINFNNKGSGDAQFVGTTDSFNVQLQGSGDLNARFLEANDVNIVLEGSGDGIISAAMTLIATLSGSGDIIYYGNPGTVTTSNQGSGNIYAH